MYEHHLGGVTWEVEVSPPLGQKLAPFASDIPPAYNTRDALFQGAGRAGISHGKHTPPPTLHSFDCGHYAGQLIESIGTYHILGNF